MTTSQRLKISFKNFMLFGITERKVKNDSGSSPLWKLMNIFLFSVDDGMDFSRFLAHRGIRTDTAKVTSLLASVVVLGGSNGLMVKNISTKEI